MADLEIWTFRIEGPSLDRGIFPSWAVEWQLTASVILKQSKFWSKKSFQKRYEKIKKNNQFLEQNA